MSNQIKEKLDLYSEDDFYYKIICGAEIGHARNTRELLKRKGIKTANDVLNRESLSGIVQWVMAKILRELDAYGYRRADCSIEQYPTIDDYCREHFHCQWCGHSLTEDSNIGILLCSECNQRRERLDRKKILEVHLEVNTQESNGIAAHISIKNNAKLPLMIKLSNSSLNHNHIQIASDDFSRLVDEYCILPDATITLNLIWLNVERLCSGDYFIVSCVDKTFNKQYTYKFGRHYSKHDYWEVDLNNPKTE